MLSGTIPKFGVILYTGANAFFAIAPLSEQIILECAFPYGISNVEWMNESAPLQGRANTAVISKRVLVNEDSHGQSYICSGTDSFGRSVYQQYTIIARGERERKFKCVPSYWELLKNQGPIMPNIQ